MQKSKEAQMAEYKQILTTEQYAQLEKTQAERAANRGNKKGAKRKKV